MAMKLTDKVMAPSRGSVNDAVAFAWNAGRKAFLLDYLAELWLLCTKHGYDFSILAAQSANETDNWTSNPGWSYYGNPAGIGITGVTGGAAGPNVSLVYKNGKDAARAHIVHMWAYTRGRIPAGHELRQYIPLDPRYDAVFENNDMEQGKPLAASVKTLGDFNVSGRWAIVAGPPEYGQRIVNRGNEVFPKLSPPVDPPVTPPTTPEEPVVEYNYNNGVKPSIKDYEVDEDQKYGGYISPANHFIGAVIIHSAYGNLEGSSSWFAGGHALTDYMVGNGMDGGTLDGELRRFNDPYGARYAWASGPVTNPIDDAAKFLEVFGPSAEAINMYTTAIERSCYANGANNPVTEKEHKKRVSMIAYHANEYGKRVKAKTGKDGFTCDTFPLIPDENNRSFLIYHGEINSGKRDTCPEPVVRETIDRIIADVRTLLASWQKTGVVDPIPPQVPPDQMPVYAEPKPIPALEAYKTVDDDAVPAYVKVGKDTMIFVADRVKAIKNTPRYQAANTKGKKIGQDITAGEEFAVTWMFFDDKGIPWYISPYWTRVLVNDTERIKDDRNV